jgi:hypothetical protein
MNLPTVKLGKGIYSDMDEMFNLIPHPISSLILPRSRLSTQGPDVDPDHSGEVAGVPLLAAPGRGNPWSRFAGTAFGRRTPESWSFMGHASDREAQKCRRGGRHRATTKTYEARSPRPASCSFFDKGQTRKAGVVMRRCVWLCSG